MAALRNRCRAEAWLAIVALLGSVLALIAPAQAARIVDDVQGALAICVADCAQSRNHQGHVPEPASPDTGSRQGYMPDSPDDDCVALEGEAFPPPRSPSTPHGARSSHAREGGESLRIGGIGSRAPPPALERLS